MTGRLNGFVVVVLSLAIGLIGGVVAAAAQDATPSSEVPNSHPAHIHMGTCEELGDVVFPLENVDGEVLEGTPEATPIPADSASGGEVVGMSQSVVEGSLDDMLADAHAVNVHESEENMGNYIACANIEGEVDEDGSLILQLNELNDSGYAGQVVLSEVDEGTSVNITLTDAQVEGEDGEATPAA